MVARGPNDIWARARRARLLQVLAVYVSASFIVLQVVDLFIDKLGLPDWFFPGGVALLLIGLPIIVATAVVQSVPNPLRERAPSPKSKRERRSERRSSSPASTADSPSAEEVAAASTHWLTWRKAILAGVVAFAIWGLVAAGYMAMRVLGVGPVGSLVAAGALDARDRILVADFDNRSPEPTLGQALTEAFRIDLAQTTLVRVVEPGRVAEALARMQQRADAPLDLALAREVAIREGIKAVVAGEVTKAGTGYVLSARLVAAEDGVELAGFRENATDSTAVIAAIDRLSKRMRERIGESLRTIRANQPLERVTTSSLEALRLYSQAMRAFDSGDDVRAQALLEETLRLDPGFAMAYRKLGVIFGNRREDRSGQIEVLKRAIEHIDRLTERERYLTLATYYNTIGERDQAVTAYETLLATYADDETALNNLGNLYQDRREYARALVLHQRAFETGANAVNMLNLAFDQFGVGLADEAQATFEELARRFPDAGSEVFLAQLRTRAGQYADAEAHLHALRDAKRADLRWRAITSIELADLAALRGKLADAERHLADAMAAQEERGQVASYIEGAVTRGRWDIVVRGDAQRAFRGLEAALTRHPLGTVAPLDRPYAGLVNVLALGGRLDRAQAHLAEWEASLSADLRPGAEWQLGWARGALALGRSRPADAIPELRRAADGPCSLCGTSELARAYDLAGQPDSAIAVYERYVDGRELYRTGPDAAWLAISYERLGDLYEGRADTTKAADYYRRFVDLWHDADPELQPRVEEVRRRLTRLAAPEAAR
ncbi:MAG: tetratricopeptide repeat protein [Gemmatimonadetes bacterium]|nr:tetratricopeptide repeat protein [Gemmatimonadota bacterium]